MFFIPILAVVGLGLKTAVTTKLFVSGVTLGTSTYIGTRKLNKR